MRKILIMLMLGLFMAGMAGAVYATKIKVGIAVTFPADI